MTADLVNLRRARKAKARVEKENVATANRAAHGRTRGERVAQRVETTRLTRLLEGHRREPTVDRDDGDGS